MNEFTIEELNLILKSIWWGGEDDDIERLQDLDNKIQSMIDNYCEHKIAFIIHYNGNKIKCLKCNKSWN